MKLLILGLGAIGQRHVRAAKRIKPDLNVLALRSKKGLDVSIDDNLCVSQSNLPISADLGIDETESIAYAREFSASHLIDSRIPSLHLHGLGQFIDKQTKILVEKPLSSLPSYKLEELLLHERIVKNNIFVGYHLLGSSSVRKLRDYLSSHTPLRYSLIHNEHIAHMQPFRSIDSMHESKMSLSGGIQYSFSHGLQLVNHLFGKSTLNWRDPSVIKLPKLDSTDIFPVEHFGLLHSNFGNDIYGTIDLAFDSHQPRFELSVFCVGSTFVLDLISNSVSVWVGHKKVDEDSYPGESKVKLLEYQMKKFLALNSSHVTDQSLCSYSDGLDCLSICEQLGQSQG